MDGVIHMYIPSCLKEPRYRERIYKRGERDREHDGYKNNVRQLTIILQNSAGLIMKSIQ